MQTNTLKMSVIPEVMIFVLYTGRLTWNLVNSFSRVACCKRTDGIGSESVDPKPAGRIIGGSESTPHYWRFMASIQYTNGFHFCGGALITPDWVLTAAHCVENMGPSQLRTVLGEHSLFISEGTEQVLDVKSIHLNPFYNLQHPDFMYYMPYDLALLELNQSAVIDKDYVNTIDLPAGCEGFLGRMCTIIGWGKNDPKLPDGTGSEFLQESQVTVLGVDSCRNTWGNFIYYGTVCVFTYGVTPCAGDSGGPLVCLDDGYRFVLAGVSSWGDSECGNHPAIYSKVSEHLGWIHDVTKMSS